MWDDRKLLYVHFFFFFGGGSHIFPHIQNFYNEILWFDMEMVPAGPMFYLYKTQCETSTNCQLVEIYNS